MTTTYVLMHRGVSGCGKLAVRWRTRPEPGALIRAEDVIWPDVKDGDPTRCGSCGAYMDFRALDVRAHVDEETTE